VAGVEDEGEIIGAKAFHELASGALHLFEIGVGNEGDVALIETNAREESGQRLGIVDSVFQRLPGIVVVADGEGHAAASATSGAEAAVLGESGGGQA